MKRRLGRNGFRKGEKSIKTQLCIRHHNHSHCYNSVVMREHFNLFFIQDSMICRAEREKGTCRLQLWSVHLRKTRNELPLKKLKIYTTGSKENKKNRMDVCCWRQRQMFFWHWASSWRRETSFMTSSRLKIILLWGPIRP